MYMSTMAKQLSNQQKGDRSPFGADPCANFDVMTLDSFRMWSAAALKGFLAIRKRSIDGTHEELAAR